MRQKRFCTWKLALTAAVVVFLLSTIFTVSGVFAALGDTTKVITVREGSVGCEIDKDYNLRNTGNVPVLLRAKLVVNWLDKDGNPMTLPPEDAVVSIKTLPEWTQFPADAEAVTEGCWYYSKVLEPGAKVSLIDSISSDGGEVRVTVLAEAIQSTPQEAAAEAWGMTWANGRWTKQ